MQQTGFMLTDNSRLESTTLQSFCPFVSVLTIQAIYKNRKPEFFMAKAGDFLCFFFLIINKSHVQSQTDNKLIPLPSIVCISKADISHSSVPQTSIVVQKPLKTGK